MKLYRGYVETRNKRALSGWKNGALITEEQADMCREYAGVLAENTILLDIDDTEQSEMVLSMVRDLKIKCKVVRTTRGKHFYFKNDGCMERCKTKVKLACGLKADFKVGVVNSYAIVKFGGVLREVEYDTCDYEQLPKFLQVVEGSKADFTRLEAGDGRNNTLFSYILTLQRNGLNEEEIKQTIRLINDYVLPEPLSKNEIKTILRPEAFKQQLFVVQKKFQHHKFAELLIAKDNVIKLNHQLHIYKDGIYIASSKLIEAAMIRHMPQIKDSQRKETLKYLELYLENIILETNERYIAFNNGIYDLVTDELLDFNSDMIITNKCSCDYNPIAYNKKMDTALNQWACGDMDVRNLLEECVGYCLYRRNELGKAFFLVGDKSNGKSTYLDIVKRLLGTENLSSLDVSELGDRFSTSMMYNKLANIGDDISDDFLRGREISMFKKIVTGNRIKAERKGCDPFEFEPYCKLLFSANNIPRTKDMTGAVMRRLVIVPFNATFSPDDENFDPWIKYELVKPEAIEYLAVVAIKGLRRVINNKRFSESARVENELKRYKYENNPILGFMDTIKRDDIIGEPTSTLFNAYVIFCMDNHYKPMSKIMFNKHMRNHFNCDTKVKSVRGASASVYV